MHSTLQRGYEGDVLAALLQLQVALSSGVVL